MNEEEYGIIAHVFADRLNELGFGDIVDPRNYFEINENGVAERYNPYVHLIGMLEAFDRHLACIDVNTYHKAMEMLKARDRRHRLKGAFVQYEFPVRTRVDLSRMPDCRQLRTRIRQMIENLPYPSPDGSDPMPGLQI